MYGKLRRSIYAIMAKWFTRVDHTRSESTVSLKYFNMKCILKRRLSF